MKQEGRQSNVVLPSPSVQLQKLIIVGGWIHSSKFSIKIILYNISKVHIHISQAVYVVYTVALVNAINCKE